MAEKVGRYEVLARLTLGGMAELSLGSTAGPGGFRKYVVLKRILPEAAGDESFVKMFLDEARITAAFSHPSICQVFELGQDKTSGLFVAMEFIAGQDLNQVVAACARQAAVLPIGFSASVVHDCAVALHYAHTFKLPNGDESPVVHRDVAQKNIMVTYEGQVKLLDFGIAKARGALSRTKAGTVKGTAGYMAPEQVRGEAIDGRSDVFSLGVVLWEMITGRRLFSAETEIEELKMILSAPISPPHEVEPSVPEELSAVAMKALERKPDDRYRTARDLARALSQQCGHLLFDAEERASFMRQRFEDKIASTQKLFDVAASSSAQEVDDAVEAFRRSSQHERETADVPKAKVRQKVSVSAGKLGQVSASKLKPVSAKPKGASAKKLAPVAGSLTKQEEWAATEAQVSTTAPPADKPGLIKPVLFAGVVALLFFGVWRVLAVDEAPKPVVQQPIGEIPGIASPGDGIPGTDTLTNPQKTPGKNGTDPSPTTDPIVKRPPPASREKGEVTLVLPDGATVLRGKQELGRGTIVSFSLPVGTHLLTVRGEDGVSRKLSLPVSAGKNKAVRYKLDDIPPQ